MNKELEDKYLSVIEDNVNVGKTSELKEFGVLLAGIVGICIAIYFSAGFIANIWIDKMSNETQVKIENALSLTVPKPKSNKYPEKISYLYSIKPKIVALDKNLQGKSKFPIFEDKNEEVNAYIVPNGNIYFTEGLLKEVEDEQALAFVLAHELAHYAHRDHLKGVGRELIAGVLLTIISAGQADTSKLINGISSMSSMQYSREQERQADLYANKVILELYGTNEGAIKFFELIAEKEKVPEYLYYFSTHPAPGERIQLIQYAR